MYIYIYDCRYYSFLENYKLKFNELMQKDNFLKMLKNVINRDLIFLEIKEQMYLVEK